MNPVFGIAFFLFFQNSTAAVAQWKGYASDEHLREGQSFGVLSASEVSATLAPDETHQDPSFSSSRLRLVRQFRGQPRAIQNLPLELVLQNSQGQKSLTLKTDQNGEIALPICDGTIKDFLVTAKTQSTSFSIKSSSQVYSISSRVDCSGITVWTFFEDSPAGQLLGIWQIAETARQKLEATVGLQFWTSPIEFQWPESGDYYSFGTVHISRGDHWDVVGHELGHAIYDLADLGQFGGGQHKIDECYSGALALSEGWASYFSAWISNDPKDPDARFEYMVPRRSPIRFENIPDDVCKGETNEWRVIGFFWDLFDEAADQETIQQEFRALWLPLRGSRAASAQAAARELRRGGISAETLSLSWTLNFGTASPKF